MGLSFLSVSIRRNFLQTFFHFRTFAMVAAFFILGGAVALAQEKPATPPPGQSGTKFVKGIPITTALAEREAADGDLDEHKESKIEPDSPEQIRKREEWFYRRRSSANGHIPPGAHLRASQHVQRMIDAQTKLSPANGKAFSAAAAPLVAQPWVSIGPTPASGGIFSPVTGRITTIAVDPNDTTGNTVLIGGAQGGIWRTTDGGNTWTPVGDQNASLAMGSIAFAPSSPVTVYAGTGEQALIGFDIYYGAGVLKSTDHGQTWAQTCTTPSATCPFIGPFFDQDIFGFFNLGGARISYVSVNPTNPNMVLVAAQTQIAQGPTEGVYCSDDGGVTWHPASGAIGEMATFVGFGTSSVAYAALGNGFGSTTTPGNGIYKATGIGSTCGTVNFSRLTAPTLPAQSTIGRIDIGIAPSDATGNTLYASIASSGGSTTNLGVFHSTDGGSTWTRTTAPDICMSQCWYDNVVKVDPTNASIAFFGGAAVSDNAGNPQWVQRTTNGGTTWFTVIPNVVSSGLPHVDTHAITMFKATSGTFSGKVRAYLGNDGGIWRSDDAEAPVITWNNLNAPSTGVATLTLAQFYPGISIHPSSASVAYGGTQDNGCLTFGVAAPPVWTDDGVCGDGTSTGIDPVTPSTVYVLTNGLNILFSFFGGAPPSPTTPFFISANAGINPNDNFDFVVPFTLDPIQTGVLYVGTTKVYQSLDGTNSFQALTGDLVNPTNGDVLTAVAVAPKNSAVVYAGASNGNVFSATNVSAGAANFTPVTGQGSLPPRTVTSIAVDPFDSTGKTAYVAFSGFAFVGGTITDKQGHVFKTTDGGATWSDVSCSVADCSGTLGANDLPNSPVNAIVLDPDQQNTIYVGTDHGVFSSTCSAAPCNWAVVGSGLPRAAVLSMAFHRASRTLRAGTHGRGMFDFTFAPIAATEHITGISPVSANAGDPAITPFTVSGNNFTANSKVKFAVNGTPTILTTTFVNATQLTATISMGSLASGGVAQVSVTDGATTTNSLPFVVQNPIPVITTISPTTVTAGTTNFSLTINGSNIVCGQNGTLGVFNGFTLQNVTTCSATSITVPVPNSDLAVGATAQIDLFTQQPGGGPDLNPTPPVLTINNPLPTLASILPTSATAGGGAFTLNLTGTNFNASSIVNFNGAAKTTMFIDAAHLSASILAADIAAAGTKTVTVSNPTPGGGTSTPVLNFTVSATNNPVPTVATINPTSASAGGAAFTLMVTGTNFVSNSVVNFNGAAKTTTFTDASHLSASILASDIATAGTKPVTVTNPAPGGGTSTPAVNFTVNATPSFTVSGSAATATAGMMGTSTITVTPSNGFTDMVAITCSGVPGATCGATSINVQGASAATGPLTINTTAPSSTTMASVIPTGRVLSAHNVPPNNSAKGWWTLSGGTGLAAIMLLFLPGRKRYRTALGLGLICVLSFALGCGGGNGGGGGGPVATTTQLTVSTTKVAANGMITVSATVTGGTPTGTVQFFVDGTAVGNAAPLTGGSTGNITVTAANAPAFLPIVGTHTVTAHYSGSATTMASQSGTLNVAVTGTTQLAITGTSGGTTANGMVSLTIN